MPAYPTTPVSVAISAYIDILACDPLPRPQLGGPGLDLGPKGSQIIVLSTGDNMS